MKNLLLLHLCLVLLAWLLGQLVGQEPLVQTLLGTDSPQTNDTTPLGTSCHQRYGRAVWRLAAPPAGGKTCGALLILWQQNHGAAPCTTVFSAAACGKSTPAASCSNSNAGFAPAAGLPSPKPNSESNCVSLFAGLAAGLPAVMLLQLKQDLPHGWLQLLLALHSSRVQHPRHTDFPMPQKCALRSLLVVNRCRCARSSQLHGSPHWLPGRMTPGHGPCNSELPTGKTIMPENWSHMVDPMFVTACARLRWGERIPSATSGGPRRRAL